MEKFYIYFYKNYQKYLQKMEDTIIYLIRHAVTIDENWIINTDETMQEINEKEILSKHINKISKNRKISFGFCFLILHIFL